MYVRTIGRVNERGASISLQVKHYFLILVVVCLDLPMREVVPQKIAHVLLNFFIIDFGIATYCMIWFGKVESVDLMRVALPAKERKLVFYPASLALKLSRRNWKSDFVGRLWNIGKPKYLPTLVFIHAKA